ncbi:hypothetical protein OsJ_30807 [Oryza sativa Japonica Group]|uniref:Uncharacterized protein n=1 Tax=Oryza sativa subsp. japonica TaxID=39947 RepID=B9G7M7_ORYSJ|nr:hypothetical protein OsJ_30807 [Oryza sativa Japonica Group]
MRSSSNTAIAAASSSLAASGAVASWNGGAGAEKGRVGRREEVEARHLAMAAMVVVHDGRLLTLRSSRLAPAAAQLSRSAAAMQLSKSATAARRSPRQQRAAMPNAVVPGGGSALRRDGSGAGQGATRGRPRRHGGARLVGSGTRSAMMEA